MILGDSGDYELLTQGVQAIIKDPNDTYSLSLEIGVREGAGSLTIMEAFNNYHKNLPYTHLGVDPYGNLNYQHYDQSGCLSMRLHRSDVCSAYQRLSRMAKLSYFKTYRQRVYETIC
jgi:hypothetical protein